MIAKNGKDFLKIYQLFFERRFLGENLPVGRT